MRGAFLYRADGSREQGFAYLEISVWSVFLLPVILLAAGVIGVVHDHIRMQNIPVSAVREHSAPALRFRVEGANTHLEVNNDVLRLVIRSIRDRIVVDGTKSLVGGITDVSAVACFWVFRVNQTTGRLTSREREVCERTGALSDRMSLEQNLSSYQATTSGYPLFALGGTPNYMEYAVLIGGAIAGRVKGVPSVSEESMVQFVHISLPREEVSL
jgi:hypothetical protein